MMSPGFTLTDAFAVLPFTDTLSASHASFATVLRFIRRETGFEPFYINQ